MRTGTTMSMNYYVNERELATSDNVARGPAPASTAAATVAIDQFDAIVVFFTRWHAGQCRD